MNEHKDGTLMKRFGGIDGWPNIIDGTQTVISGDASGIKGVGEVIDDEMIKGWGGIKRGDGM